MSAPTTTNQTSPTPMDAVGVHLPHAGVAVAVLGARDSGAAELAAELREHTAASVVENLGTAPADGPGSADAAPRVDIALVAVDLICPIRPDDLDAIILLARRFPVAVVLVRAERYQDFARTADTIAGQLHRHDIPAPLLHQPGEGLPTSANAGHARLDTVHGAGLLTAARERGRRGGRGTSDVIPGGSAAPAATAAGGRDPRATLDWLQRARTEAVTARSAVLRQQSQSARIALQTLVSRQIRELSVDAKASLAAAKRRDLESEVAAIDTESAELSRRVSAAVGAEAAGLRRRHLGSASPLAGAAVPVQVSLRFSRPPIHRGEELVFLLMGSAGGAGLGRLLAMPFGGSWAALAVIIPLALAAGAVLGSFGVRARRVAALRSHLIGSAAEHFAALRAEIELAVSEHFVQAEAAITDAFAHDTGPRVRDLEKRIATLRQSIHGDPKETAGLSNE